MRRFAIRALANLDLAGSFEARIGGGRPIRVGNGPARDLAIRIADRRTALAILLDPYLHIGQAFMDGRLVMERGTVYDFLALLLEGSRRRPLPPHLRALSALRRLTRRWRQRNSTGRARRNVSHHYDLDGRLYSLFLDADRQYSCAYFEHPGQSLDDAQLAKKRRIAAKLLVEPGQKVLDVGSGWGGLGLYLAGAAQARVVGVTLSEEQLAVARCRASEAGLAGEVEFRLQDYRRIAERFDRIVSVGMLEHVGVGFFDTYFNTLRDLLADDGVMLIHAIGRPEGPAATNPWIDRHIFPGGYIPALSEVLASVERSGLVVTDVEMLRLHYAETLKGWRERFMARRDEAVEMRGEAFCRMWEFYLAGSETAFRFEELMVFQIQLARRQESVPLTRDYIAGRERALKQRDSARPPLRLAGE